MYFTVLWIVCPTYAVLNEYLTLASGSSYTKSITGNFLNVGINIFYPISYIVLHMTLNHSVLVLYSTKYATQGPEPLTVAVLVLSTGQNVILNKYLYIIIFQMLSIFTWRQHFWHNAFNATCSEPSIMSQSGER